jgi:ATP-dependent RNA helicase DeaD
VYVHRIGRTGRYGETGRAITFVEPRQRRELEAIEKHANTTISPWAEGAHVAPARAEEPARRGHRKPRDPATYDANGHFRTLIASGGRAAGLAEGDLIHAITSRAGLDGEAVRNVRLLERFALLEVPAPEAERIVAAVDGADVRGHVLRVQPART